MARALPHDGHLHTIEYDPDHAELARKIIHQSDVSDKITVWMERMGLKDDEPIEHRWITRAIENAQKKVEGHHFQMRKNLLEYDDVMNYQRKAVYELRRRALAGDGVVEMIEKSVENVMSDLMDDCAGEGIHPEHWQLAPLRERLQRVFGIVWTDSDAQLRDHSRAELQQRMLDESRAKLLERIASLGQERFELIARTLVLRFADQGWKDHLLANDRLRQGVGLRGYGQRNPLLEYKKEAYHMYLLMEAMRDEAVVQQIFHMEDQVAAMVAASPTKATARRVIQAGPAAGALPPATGALKEDGFSPLPAGPLAIPAAGQPFVLPPQPAAAPRRPEPGEEARAVAIANGVRRNDPCPCGSGSKYKKCCGAQAGEPSEAAETPGA
jgi:preprotein translocase subunit SecA